jgi:hypothetical protein
MLALLLSPLAHVRREQDPGARSSGRSRPGLRLSPRFRFVASLSQRKGRAPVKGPSTRNPFGPEGKPGPAKPLTGAPALPLSWLRIESGGPTLLSSGRFPFIAPRRSLTMTHPFLRSDLRREQHLARDNTAASAKKPSLFPNPFLPLETSSPLSGPKRLPEELARPLRVPFASPTISLLYVASYPQIVLHIQKDLR